MPKPRNDEVIREIASRVRGPFSAPELHTLGRQTPTQRGRVRKSAPNVKSIQNCLRGADWAERIEGTERPVKYLYRGCTNGLEQ